MAASLQLATVSRPWLRSRGGDGLDPGLAGAGLGGFSADVDAPVSREREGTSLAAFRAAQAAGLLLCAETAVNRWNIVTHPRTT